MSSPETALAEKELFELLKALSFRRGNFTLASGQQSDFYLDCRMTTLSARGSYLIGQLLYERLAELNVDAVGGMSMGADPMVTAITCRSAEVGKSIDGFLIRKEAKGHGTGRQIEGHLQPWMRVALVEDVVTTGGSTLKAIEAIRRFSSNIEIVEVLSLVDRKGGGPEAFKRLGIPFRSLYSIDAFLRG